MAVRDISLAIANLTEARKEHDAAYENYSGRSWGWAGSRYIRAVEEAEKDLKDVLQEHITQGVREALKALGFEIPSNQED